MKDGANFGEKAAKRLREAVNGDVGTVGDFLDCVIFFVLMAVTVNVICGCGGVQLVGLM